MLLHQLMQNGENIAILKAAPIKILPVMAK
jgi:hypothetical protein